MDVPDVTHYKLNIDTCKRGRGKAERIKQ